MVTFIVYVKENANNRDNSHKRQKKIYPCHKSIFLSYVLDVSTNVDTTSITETTLFTKRWITLREAIGSLPALRAEKGRESDKNNPLHKVPILDKKKLWWLDNTPEGSTAFNNQCVNPACCYQENPLHGARYNEEGINKFNADTPLYCGRCGELLPRPYVEDKVSGEKRIMKGFTSAYKRMFWDEPASTLTQNFQYACSDNKVHPSQTRVLSLWEGIIIQTIAQYTYSFIIDGKQVKDGLIRDTIGECVPPKIIDLVCKNKKGTRSGIKPGGVLSFWYNLSAMKNNTENYYSPK